MHERFSEYEPKDISICTLKIRQSSFQIFYTPRSGFLFFKIPKLVCMVDCDLSSDEKHFLGAFAKEIVNYAKEESITTRVYETANGMHTYIATEEESQYDNIRHMRSLACDPDYTGFNFQ